MNPHNYLTNIIKTVAGVNGPAPEFTKVKLSNADYFTLQQRVARIINNAETGEHTVEHFVEHEGEAFHLAVKVFITAESETVQGGKDDYGNYEELTLTRTGVHVISHMMIDADCNDVACDFSADELETYF